MSGEQQLFAAAGAGRADEVQTLIAARAKTDAHDMVSDGAGTGVAAFLDVLVICLKMAVV